MSFDMSLRDNLLLMFFTTVGLSADARMLAQGRTEAVDLSAWSASCSSPSRTSSASRAALAMDLHPVVGLLGGSITLTGGHGTGAAYGGRFGDTMNIAGAMELTMACATAGLVLGSVLGGPLAEYSGQTPPAVAGEASGDRSTVGAADEPTPTTITAQSMLNTLFAILACLAGGKDARAARRRAPGSSCRIFCSVCCSASPSATSATLIPRRPCQQRPRSICSAASRSRCFWSWR